MSTKIININDITSLTAINSQVESVENAKNSLKAPISEAVKILNEYKETIDYKPEEALRVLNILGINERQNPEEMSATIHSSNKAFITRKKQFTSTITQAKLETTLTEIISELSTTLNGVVMKAIVDLVKNIISVCAIQDEGTQYNELSFRFFTKNKNDNVIILVINVRYEEKAKSINLLSRLLNYVFHRVHISFFAAVVRTLPFKDL